MDWRSIRFDWNHARAFLVVAEEGSLTAAAKALGVSQPTLGRQVASLESALGVALFERGTRGLELTPNGLRLAEYVQGMGEAASQLSLVASGQSQAIEGSVCISTNEMEAVLVMPDLLRRLREEEPGIDVEIIASQSASDLKRREADIAIRGFRPTQPDLIARRLPDQENYLYASSGYLDSIGRPQTVEGQFHWLQPDGAVAGRLPDNRAHGGSLAVCLPCREPHGALGNDPGRPRNRGDAGHHW